MNIILLQLDAFKAGILAAKASKVRAPALCPVFRELITNGAPAVEMAKAWLHGYQSECDEQANLILDGTE
jgi:hypothetical protein